MGIVRLMSIAVLLLCSTPALALDYTYDSLNRLTSIVYDNGQQITYTYDAAGNRLTMNATALITAPDAFSFTPQTNVARSTLVTSNTITVTATVINATEPISIKGGEYRIGGAAFTSAPGTVSNNQTVTVRLTSAATYSTLQTATLTIGGASSSFNVTTVAAPATPNSFSFTTKTGVPLNTWQTSSTVTLSGLAVAANISITGGEYSINGGAFTAAAGSISNGQTLAVRVQSSSSYSTDATTTVTVGGLSVPFTVTTGSMPLSTANLSIGWNLVGNGLSGVISVASIFNDPAQVSTVWKWIPGASPGWAFYTPSLVDGGAAYAASKGYSLLQNINGGEGFWVNAKTVFNLTLPAGNTITTTTLKDAATPPNPIPTGWSLIAVGDSPSPRAFANGIALTPPAPLAATSLTTLWAWDSVLGNWYFYAPSLDNAGTLQNYITSKGYLDFTTNNKTLGPGVGFWVNKP